MIGTRNWEQTSILEMKLGGKKEVAVPFLPNSGYAFPASKNSWHGVDVIPHGAPIRNSLMMVWYVDGIVGKIVAKVRNVSWKFQSEVPCLVEQIPINLLT